MKANRNRNAEQWSIYTDGAIRPERGISGLAAIVRDRRGQIRFWWKRQAREMTCNEAEYAAAIFALEMMQRRKQRHPVEEIRIYSDSKIMVEQMSGRASTQAPGLLQAQRRLQKLVDQFKNISFHHIPREQNRLADALAFEALGITTAETKPELPSIHQDVCDELISTWRLP